MDNQHENQEFRNVCDNLQITDREERSGFHRYLANNYAVEKDYMGYQELLRVGVEYMRYELRREPPHQYRNL